MKRRTFRKKLLALALAAAMAGLSACSGGGSGEPAKASGTSEAKTQEPAGSSQETAAKTQEPAESTQEAQTAGSGAEVDILRVGVGAMSVNFNPCKDMGIQALRMMYNIHDRLMYTDKDGTIKPQLAESWSWVDDKTFELKLRKDVKFHNGDSFTAEDVKFTFDMAISKEVGMAMTQVVESVESAEVVDDYTVRLHLKWPDSVIETRLGATRTAYILPSRYYKEKGGLEGYNAAPVGCGPFKVASIMQGEKIVLERFEDYYGEKPQVKTVEFIKYGEDSTRMTALLNGEVDIINDIKNDLVANFQNEANIKTHITPIKLFHLYIYNTKEGPTANKKLRQAMNMAIDRELLVKSLWGDGARVPNGWQVEEFGDYYIEDYESVKYDPEKARALVAESGYDGSVIELQMVPNYYVNDVQAAEVCVDLWKQVGINVQIVYIEKADKNIPGLRTWSCAVRFDDPLGAIWVQFPDSEWADYCWPDPPQEIYTEAGDVLKNSQEKEVRRQAARRFLEIMDEEVPASYLYLPEEIWGIRTDRNFEWDPYWTIQQIISLRTEDFRAK